MSTRFIGAAAEAAPPTPEPLPAASGPVAIAAAVDVAGRVVVRRAATVSSAYTAQVKASNVREGDAVQAGQVLAELDSSEADAAVRSAEGRVAQLGAARAQAEAAGRLRALQVSRARTLAEKGYASAAALDELKSAERWRRLSCAAGAILPVGWRRSAKGWLPAAASIEQSGPGRAPANIRSLERSQRLQVARLCPSPCTFPDALLLPREPSINSLMMDPPAYARALGSPEEINRRRAMLATPHIAPLTDWVTKLRRDHPHEEFPDFDPLGGGVHADILFVLEKPGPMTSVAGGGSGFISVDNDDETAEASRYFLLEVGIERSRTCHWNIIPGWNGEIPYRAKDWRSGMPALLELVDLLPKLKAVVLVGNTAQRAEDALRARRLGVFKSAHPSRRVQNAYPEKWAAIAGQWRAAREFADQAR